jgi:hypothetical protein
MLSLSSQVKLLAGQLLLKTSTSLCTSVCADLKLHTMGIASLLPLHHEDDDT